MLRSKATFVFCSPEHLQENPSCFALRFKQNLVNHIVAVLTESWKSHLGLVDIPLTVEVDNQGYMLKTIKTLYGATIICVLRGIIFERFFCLLISIL